MTWSAWLTLALTWSVVLYFVIRFFLKALKTPVREETDMEFLRKDA
ncbi:hypothetical protein JW906_16445 [bacterium]|nr:hypothetical protein [bacterium]